MPHHNIEFDAGEYTPDQMVVMGETVEAVVGGAITLASVYLPPLKAPKIITVLGSGATGVGTGYGVWKLMDPLTQGMVTGSKLWYSKWDSIHKKWSGSAYIDGEYGGFHWQADHFTTAHGLSWPDEFDGVRQVSMFRISSDPNESHVQGPPYEHRVYGYWRGVTDKFEKIEAGDLWHANFDPLMKFDGVYIGVRE